MEEIKVRTEVLNDPANDFRSDIILKIVGVLENRKTLAGTVIIIKGEKDPTGFSAVFVSTSE